MHLNLPTLLPSPQEYDDAARAVDAADRLLRNLTERLRPAADGKPLETPATAPEVGCLWSLIEALRLTVNEEALETLQEALYAIDDARSAAVM